MPAVHEKTDHTEVEIDDRPGQFLSGAFALIFNQRDEILILRERPETRRYDWDLPGGTLHQDEDPLDAVRREVREETGLTIHVEHPLCFLKYDRHQSGRSILVSFYVAEAVTTAVRLSHEHEAYRWIAEDTLRREHIELPPGVRATAELFRLHRHLRAD